MNSQNMDILLRIGRRIQTEQEQNITMKQYIPWEHHQVITYMLTGFPTHTMLFLIKMQIKQKEQWKNNL